MCQHVLHAGVKVRHDWTPPEPEWSEIKCFCLVAQKQSEVWSYGPGSCQCTKEVDHHLPPGADSSAAGPSKIDPRLKPGSSGMDTSEATVSNIQIPCPKCRDLYWAVSFKGSLLKLDGKPQVPAPAK